MSLTGRKCSGKRSKKENINKNKKDRRARTVKAFMMMFFS